MAAINSKVLFLTTSPRTPEKMIPEIDLLLRNFEGQLWDRGSQAAFMEILADEEYFFGEGAKDPAFSARDRINRGPKSLGFVNLSPTVSITDAGKALLTSRRRDEALLRQLLKFQIPSPYHKPTKDAADFCIRPYLELLRLISVLGTLRFDELQIFGMQLTDWRQFGAIVKKVEKFRRDKLSYSGSYREFKAKYLDKELRKVYSTELSQGKIKTRESFQKSKQKFLDTKGNNMRDYADAAFRYLRATGLVSVSHIGKSLSIIPERQPDVDYILSTVNRNPCYVDDEKRYVDYLGDASIPKLLTDNKERLILRIRDEFPSVVFDETESIEALKDLLMDLTSERKTGTILRQVKDIKDYKLYDEIQKTYSQIVRNELYDSPLMLEWNTWRAMTMLDGGDIKANLSFDDFGKPLSTASGNMADIVCDYGDYILSVEVTMATGQKQYDMEGEPVSRHLGKLKKSSNKPCYCLFVAPKINEACVAHFFALHRVNISYYGGTSVIVPLPIEVFVKMLEDSYQADYTPSPNHLRNFFEYSNELVDTVDNEIEWHLKIQAAAVNWLSLK